MLNNAPRFTVAVAIGVAVLTALATAVPTGSEVPLAPNGGSPFAQAGEILALTPSSALMVVEGPDGNIGTADDVALFLGDVDSTPTTDAIAIPRFRTYGNSAYTLPLRTSATTVLLPSSGADGAYYTADDSLHVASLLGSQNVVSEVAIGHMSGFYTSDPARLSTDLVVVGSIGPDAKFDTADDEIVLIADPGGTNTVTRLPAPNTTGTTTVGVLSPTSAIQLSNGPDSSSGTADDLAYLFTELGGLNTRTDIAVPNIKTGLGTTPIRVTSTSALLLGEGPDQGTPGADDVVYLLSDLGGLNVVTPITVGGIRGNFGQRPLVLAETVAVVITYGSDGAARTADDELVVLTDLGGQNDVTRLTLGYLNPGRVGGPPVRLSSTSCAMQSAGPDAAHNTADDEIIVIRDVGGDNTVVRVAVPGLDSFHGGIPTPLSATSLMVASGGVDGVTGTGADVISVITALDTIPLVEELAAIGRHRTFSRAHVPQSLGHGRGAYSDSGLDNVAGSGDDDVCRVIDGLPRDRELTATKVDIKFKASKPNRPAKLKVTATLLLDTPDLFLSGDLTVSIGNAAQTIAADDIEIHKKGYFFYKDKKREKGFISKLKYDPKKAKLTVVGKGLGTDAETTSADYIPVAIEVAEIYLSDAVAGKAKKSGLKYRAPKN